ncbi:MAG: flagellar M-ring protein FliF [Calditrichaeota bacterium]|nr:MAG: flagellar M-ring protein FliF [Calditrichota bacterium]MBL1204002.1 flagellar M-ring protein FliF [Calditrichota bacterium]NOG43833.1 flagellar M-ring protein FliF [Calditrichota bacterium]
MNDVVAQLTQFFLQYSLKQRAIITAIIVGFLSIVIALLMWANKTEYELLFANLAPQDASEIVTNLSNDKIKYRLENGGTTIYVQQDKMEEMRIRFHSLGAGSNAPQGFDDIFDPEKQNIGETTNMQRVKIIRAKEGELMKTLNSMIWIKGSRVHLNIPERRLFEDDRRGSASVFLVLNRSSVQESQIKSIPALISGSIDGIQPEDVRVMDSRGNLLYNGEKENTLGLSGTQWELTNSVSNEIKLKARNIVESSVGFGNSSVQVGVELNFDQVQQTIEDIDPDDVTVLSEEIINESNQDNVDSSTAAVENSVTNYEFSKTVRNIVHGTGNIKRLSVAVAVNGKYETIITDDGEENQQYVPRTPQELEDLTTLVKGAIGYNEERGDVVNVINIQFADPVVYEGGFIDNFKDFEMWKEIFMYLLIAVGLYLGFNLVKGLMNTEATSKILIPFELQKKALASGKENSLIAAAKEKTPEEEIDEDIYIAKLSPEARARMKANDKMTQDVIAFAEQNPEQVTGLMRAWLAEQPKA